MITDLPYVKNNSHTIVLKIFDNILNACMNVTKFCSVSFFVNETVGFSHTRHNIEYLRELLSNYKYMYTVSKLLSKKKGKKYMQ